MDADEFTRYLMERYRAFRRRRLQKLLKQLENPGKRQSALRTAARLFYANSADELQALLDAEPKPKITARRGKKGHSRWVVLEEEDAERTGHSVQRQDAADTG